MDPTAKKNFEIFDDDTFEPNTDGRVAIGDELKTPEELKVYVDEIKSTVRDQLQQSIEILTPWFFSNMPRIYYQTTPRAEKVRHLSAIITGHLFETNQTLVLWDPDRTKVTYLGPGNDPKVLHEMATKLTELKLKMGSIYLSHDKKIFVSSFACTPFQKIDSNNSRLVEKVRAAREMIYAEFKNENDEVEEYLKSLDADFVMYATPGRILLTYRMLRHMQYHEGAHTIFETVPDRPTARITLGLKSVAAGEALEQILYLVTRYGVSLTRSFVVSFREGLAQPISILHFHIASIDGKKIDINSPEMKKLNKALRTLGWVDRDDYSAFMQPQYNMSINATNLVRSMATWINVMLGKHNPYYYSNHKIQTTFFNYSDLTREVLNLFRIKFDPMRGNSRKGRGYTKAFMEVKEKISKLLDEVERNIFNAAINFIDNIQKTNYFLQTKTGLAFRLSPEILDPKFYPEKPFSIFYICGREYRMFHTRWKDIARGGLRVVMPKTQTDHDFALAGIYDEVYGLSHAQQLKNKDIPEGGSKGVLLLKPNGDRIQAVRGGVNALLDLLVREDESHEERSDTVVSYYDKDDIIYLGPDENITNDLIEWIPEQASRRGYPYSAAFMSSKPGAGINHKQYGVTSEGLNVYLDNMLRYLGINPRKEKFTVKITGGPDGDVAGNEMNILRREYGENARVVAIADGFGAAYDPEGLNWGELMRLFKAGQPISFFDPKILSGSTGFVIKADTTENIRIRNELHARVKSDIFLPCGGRPYTVNDRSWSLFMDEQSKPSCRAIVEGANIFFTKEARQKLQENGVLMIKDSTANKTGVICSSYEIIASLTLSEEEFLAIKETYVSQVIDILRQKADNEAKLLFREFAQGGGSRTLVDLSMDISLEINGVTDALLDEMTLRQEEILRDEFFDSLILKHCPPVLVEKYRARILEKLPPAHKIAILSAYMASNIVYREGLGWLSKLSAKDKYATCTSYMRNDRLTQEIIDTVRSSNIPNKDKVLAILSMSSTKDLTLLSISGS